MRATRTSREAVACAGITFVRVPPETTAHVQRESALQVDQFGDGGNLLRQFDNRTLTFFEI